MHSMRLPRTRRVISRSRSLSPLTASGLSHRRKARRVKRKPSKVLSHGRPTALLASLPLSLSRVARKRLRLPHTRDPARLLRTYTLLSRVKEWFSDGRQCLSVSAGFPICSASRALSWSVHHSLPIPPYVQFSRVRRSDSLHRSPCTGFATYSSMPLPMYTRPMA